MYGTCFILSGSCRCVKILRAAWRLTRRWSSGFLRLSSSTRCSYPHYHSLSPPAFYLFGVLFCFPFYFLHCPLRSGTSSRSQFSLAFSTLFLSRPFVPALPRVHTLSCSVLYCVSSLLSIGGVPISSGSGNPSATNLGGCFVPSANRGRASIFRKGDAGLISPRVHRGALLALAGALRSTHSLPGEGGLRSTPSHKQAQFTGGRCDARGALGLAASQYNNIS
jgi:hypothetical protein